MITGHDAVLLEVEALLASGQSVALVGPVGSGTRAIVERLAGRAEERMVFMALDCASLAAVDATAFFERCEAALREAMAARGIALPPPQAAGGPARLAFEAALRQLERRGLRAVLALVGLEHLAANPRVDVGLFNALRSAAGRLSLALLTTSTRPLIELTYAGDADAIRSSPFFNIFAQLSLHEGERGGA